MHRVACTIKDCPFPYVTSVPLCNAWRAYIPDLDSMYSVFSICVNGETKSLGFKVTENYSSLTFLLLVDAFDNILKTIWQN